MQWLLVLLLVVCPTIQRKHSKHRKYGQIDHVAEYQGHEMSLPSHEAKRELNKKLLDIGISPVGVTIVKVQKKRVVHELYGVMNWYRALYNYHGEHCKFEWGYCLHRTCPRGKPSTHPVCGPMLPKRKPTTSKPQTDTPPPEPKHRAKTKKPTISKSQRTTPCPDCDAIP